MLLLPPDKVDAKNKTMIDAFVDVSERDRSRRSWYWWLAVCLTSLGALWLVRYDFLPNAVRLGLAIAGGIGFLGSCCSCPQSDLDAATTPVQASNRGIRCAAVHACFV